MRLATPVVALFALAACGSDGDGGDKPGDDDDTGTHAPPDTTAPSVTVTSPLDGATVTGTLSMAATATDDVGVASVSFRVDGAEVAAAAAEPFEGSWDSTTALNGNYVVSAVATDAAGNTAEARATIEVQNEGAPSADAIRIITPVDDASLCGRLTVEAATSLDDASIVFSLDGTGMATDASEPFTWDWNTEGTSNGAHRLRATATGADGLSVQNTITVDIENTGADCDNLPSVSLTAPASGIFTWGDVELAAVATDDVGVVSVQFFVDDGMLLDDEAIPYVADWTSDDFAEGPHTIEAIATDTAGQTARTQITVNIDRTAPIVAITDPSGAEPLEGSVDASADAEDNLALDSVVFTIDGVELESQDAAPYAISWDTTTEAYGAHTIEVTATDRAGHVATDALVVEVDNPPAVSIGSPSDGDDVAGEVSVRASATDDSGSVTVTFYLDGAPASYVGSAPYTWDWDTCDVSNGAHTLAAEASDGTHTASDTVSVTVDQALEVEWVGPSGILAASETLDAYVSDDDTLVSVTWDLDGVVVASTSTRSGSALCSLTCGCDRYEASWDVSSVAEGSYTLTLTATNSAGDTVTDSVSVTVEYDADGDGYAGEEWGGDDCDDARATSSPGAIESCTTAEDDDCDGATNEEGATSCTAYYADVDVDGYGDASDSACLCSASGAYTASLDTDCDDDDASANPGAAEVCGDAVDNDCDGSASCTESLSSAVEYTGEAAYDRVGHAVAGAGDVDGDGCDDLLVGAYGKDDGGVSAGGVYLVQGTASPASSSLSSALWYMGEAASDWAGYAVAGAGDVNGDGFDDLLAGAPAAGSVGAAYLVMGSASPASSSLSSAAQYTGEASSDSAGVSVAGAGDVDGDGFDDVLLGASHNDDGPGSTSGAAYLVLGSAAPASSSLSSAVQYTGEADGDQAGFAVASAGDVDGDGLDDLLVGAHDNDDGGPAAGAAYLVLGSASPTASSLSSAAEYTGEAAGDGAGIAVAGAGDVDGDGFDDFLVDGHANDNGGTSAGAAYLVRGSVTPASSSLSSAVEYTGGTGDMVGLSLAGAGDVDGDGFDDFLVGAPYDDIGGSATGTAYLVLGSASPASSSFSSGVWYTGEVALDFAGWSVSGAGDVDGDGLDDLLVGAINNSDGGSAAGAAYLILADP